MKTLYIETFHGGAHRNFAQGWSEHSRHDFVMATLPARHWKWRQAGAALSLAKSLPADLSEFSAALVSGMIDLAHLKVLRPDLPPVLLYVHENQFAYPLGEGEERDFRYGITDLMNICSAEITAFNSHFNKESLVEEAAKLFKRLPDAVPHWMIDHVRSASRIAYPGVDGTLGLTERPQTVNPEPDSNIPLVIWNHRHEHDKDPDTAFKMLFDLKKRGILFNLAILGERYSAAPNIFNTARSQLKEHIIFDGYPNRSNYIKWLSLGDLVISAAKQENFGLSMVEAVSAGCWPLAPRRLAYPEVFPAEFHKKCLWRNRKEFVDLAAEILSLSFEKRRLMQQPMREAMERFDWAHSSALLDDLLDETADSKPRS